MRKKILVTGSKGFIAKNLITHLMYNSSLSYDVLTVDRLTNDKELQKAVEIADIIIHLAGENRPKDVGGFTDGNVSYTQKICHFAAGSGIPVIYTSSTQVDSINNYGESKLAAENILIHYSKSNAAQVAITRLPNVFGKWCKPNYNSFIATMCYNLWRDIPVSIDDVDKILTLVYVDDVVAALISKTSELLNSDSVLVNYFSVDPHYQITLGYIYDALYAIKNGQKSLEITKRAKGFERALAATFMSYCPEDKMKYSLIEHEDYRGSFYEVFKLASYGQVSISTTKPGVTRGNHFHHSKQEKFLVVKGECTFNFRSLNTGEMISLTTSEKVKEIVEVPLGFTHNFTNVGSNELVVLIWCNEEFDRNNPDTYFSEV